MLLSSAHANMRSDDLELSEAERVGVELLFKTEIKDERGEVIGYLGVNPLDELLRCIEGRRRGLVDQEGYKRSDARDTDFSGIIETARALPLWQYRRVAEAISKAKAEVADAPKPDPRIGTGS